MTVARADRRQIPQPEGRPGAAGAGLGPPGSRPAGGWYGTRTAFAIGATLKNRQLNGRGEMRAARWLGQCTGSLRQRRVPGPARAPGPRDLANQLSQVEGNQVNLVMQDFLGLPYSVLSFHGF
jgi:hypothetical protein